MKEIAIHLKAPSLPELRVRPLCGSVGMLLLNIIYKLPLNVRSALMASFAWRRTVIFMCYR